jgi:hypothetical protein
MNGEIVVRAAPHGSIELTTNQVGVGFDIRMSAPELTEMVYLHNIGNGTVILEVLCCHLTDY